MGAWLSYGLGSENEDLPGVRRADLARHRHRADQPLYDRLLGQRLPADAATRACKFRARRRPGAVPLRIPPGVDPRSAPRRCSTASRELNQLQHRRRSAIRRSHTRIAQYEMAFRMQTQRAGADGPVAGAASASSTCTAPRRSEPGTLRRELPAGAAAGRARRALRAALSTAAGTSTATCPTQTRSQCRDTDQPLRRARHGPQAARPARRHAGHLGRRVRPHRLLPGQARRANDYGRDHHPRCFTIWMAGGGIKAGHHATARPTTSATTSSKDPVHVHDLQRDDPALPGHRPHEADVQLPGPRLPPDRRPRRGGRSRLLA